MSTAAELFLATKSFCTIQDNNQMAFVDMNDAPTTVDGDTLVFLHGMPTSSYLWRNVMEPLRGPKRRLIAPDLLGMGDSGKLTDPAEGAYSFQSHVEYLDAFLDNCLGLTEEDKIILVIHDWGSALGFHWARRHPDKVKGIAYMESLVRGFDSADFTEGSGPDFLAFLNGVRTPTFGEELILQNNTSVESFLARYPSLTEDDKSVYRAPFLTPGDDRRVILELTRDVPFDGEPADVFAIVEEYSKWLPTTDTIPKLMVLGDPGFLLTGDYLEYARTFPCQKEVTVAGIHFIQEDSPVEIANAIEEWLGELPEDGNMYSSAHTTVASMLKLFVVSALVVYFF